MRYDEWDRAEKAFVGSVLTVGLILVHGIITEIILPKSEQFIKLTLIFAAFAVSVAVLGELAARIDGWLDNDEE